MSNRTESTIAVFVMLVLALFVVGTSTVVLVTFTALTITEVLLGVAATSVLANFITRVLQHGN